MNTPKTVAAIDELVIKGISVAEQIYLSAKDDAQAIRQLETQVQDLREALEKIAAKGKYDEPTMNAGRMQQLARAILEKTS